MLENLIIKEKKDIIKREFISVFANLMLFILIFYCLFFYFVVQNNWCAGYCFFGFCFSLYSWFIIKKLNYSINRIVHAYIIIASIFNLLIMSAFWKSSLFSYIWLSPIPLAAYIFFKPKTVVVYIIFIFINMTLGYILSQLFSFDICRFKDKNQLILSDTFIFIFNLVIIFLLLHYYDKIRRVEMMGFYAPAKENLILIEKKKINEEDFLKFNILFEKITQAMLNHGYFKEPDFTISKLSILLNTNNSYILKAIKQNGYNNFTTYLNVCRTDCFKNLIAENDIRKVTLMYLYTEAGFSNQSTFNRVFKQLEGITPSKYIQNIQELTKVDS